MTIFRWILAVITIFTISVADESAQAAQSAMAVSQQVCTQQDLDGLYVLIDYNETPPGPQFKLHAHFSHKYISFNGKAALFNKMAFNKEFQTPSAVLKALGPVTSYNRFTMNAGGLLNLYSGNNISYSYRCLISTGDIDNYRKGDIILTSYTKDKQSEIYELYRRW